MRLSNEIPKVCATCEHFCFISGEPDYSSLTPGSDVEISCRKRHWWVDPYEETEKGYRDKQLTALNCPDYQLVDLERG